MLPVVLAALAFIATPITAWITSLRGAGDVSRWAAISTMWVLLPLMLAGAIALAVLIAAIFILSRLEMWIPRVSHRLQRVAFGVAGGARRVTEMIRRPVLAVRRIGILAKASVRRLRERV